MRTILRDNYTPEMGAYHETLIIDEARHKKYLFDCDGVFTDITNPLVVSERGDSEDFAASQKWVTEIDDKVDGLAEDLGDEIQARTDADDAIWAEIEEIEMSSDVVDIVGTYTELQQYDTSKLHDNDIIKVLQDETHSNETAYYRWSTTTNTFSYVGSEGPYYTESEVDALLAGKQDVLIAGSNIQIASDGKTISATDTTYTHFTGATASTDGEQGLVPGPLAGDEGKFLQGDGTWGTPTDTTYTAGTNIQISNQNVISATDTTYTAGANVQISANNEISATDTTYSNFVGTDGTAAGTAGLVPAPATTDAGKFLKADGTWDDAGSPINVVQTTGISTTDVMSQDATTKMLYRDNNKSDLVVGSSDVQPTADYFFVAHGTLSNSDRGIVIGAGSGHRAVVGGAGTANDSIAIGKSSNVRRGGSSIAIGRDSWVDNRSTDGQACGMAIGSFSKVDGGNTAIQNAVALGAYSYATQKGQFDISTANGGAGNALGYNNSQYRLLTGLYDPQNDHDAATKGYVDTAVTPNNISSNDWSALWQ